MESSFNISLIISICFLIFKFSEFKITQADLPPVKNLLKESFIVFVSSLVGFFVFEQFYGGLQTGGSKQSAVFTGAPEF